jgi:membrane-associated phospholipid phosphatase
VFRPEPEPSIAAVACGAAYAALAALVAAGELTGIDQWAIDHAPAGARFGGEPPTLLESLVPLLHASFATPLQVAVDIVGLPGSAILSLALVWWCSVRLRRRAWLGAWFGGVTVEVLCREVVSRPVLYAGGRHAGSFDSSFPSGHTLRGVIAAAAVAAAWPRLRHWAAAWALALLALILAAGWHVPSDVAGGLALAGLALALLRARTGRLRSA